MVIECGLPIYKKIWVKNQSKLEDSKGLDHVGTKLYYGDNEAQIVVTP